MDEKEVEKLINAKITEAKLDSAEKTFRIFLIVASALLGLLGVVYPVYLTTKSSERVDNAVQEMKKDLSEFTRSQISQASSTSDRVDKNVEQLNKQFKELAETQTQASNASSVKIDRAIQEMRKEFKDLTGAQLRKPNLECLFDGRTLQGATLRVSQKVRDFGIEIRNVGDAPAKSVQLKVYLKTEIADDNQFFGFPRSHCDEQSYNIAFEFNVHPTSINGGYQINVPIHIALDKVSNIPALLKVYQEEGDPKKYTFSIEYKD